MAPNISGNLSRISQSASKLNTLAHKATEQIRELDEFLTRVGFGFEYLDTNFTLSGREKNAAGQMVDALYRLGYLRDDDTGKYGLAIHCEIAQVDEDGRPYGEGWEVAWVRRLDRVSRELRIQFMKSMSSFIERLAKDAEESCDSVAGDLDEVAKVTEELRAATADHRMK